MISLLRANLGLDIPIHLTMRIRKGDNILKRQIKYKYFNEFYIPIYCLDAYRKD